MRRDFSLPSCYLHWFGFWAEQFGTQKIELHVSNLLKIPYQITVVDSKCFQGNCTEPTVRFLGPDCIIRASGFGLRNFDFLHPLIKMVLNRFSKHTSSAKILYKPDRYGSYCC